MDNCKYHSFTALSKINDPDLLLESFTKNAAPDHQNDIKLIIFEKSNSVWQLRSSTDSSDLSISENHLRRLKNYESDYGSNDYMVYNNSDHAWYSAYYGLAHSSFALFISTPSKDFLVDSTYLQQLFHFYCHQLHMLHGTYHDALTGLLNRRSFDKKLFQLIEQDHQREAADNPSYYVMLDIDHFKKINDTYGHLYGDEVLLQLAQLMEDSFRDNDLLFRYGGEEFAIVLMNANDNVAQAVLERFRIKVSQYSFPKVDNVTISIGYTLFNTDLTIDETIAKADAALYYCKENGRNRTCEYQHLVDNNQIKAIVRNTDDELLLF